MYNYKKKERRKYERYDTEAKIYFRVVYDIKTKIEFQVIDKSGKGELFSEKYPAISRNVGVEGISFISDQQLNKGDFLYLEVYLPDDKKPIHMEGQVRWSQQASLKAKKKNKFDTGVKLITVEGQSVLGSVYYDEANKVVWSVVLDSVFGNFRKLTQKKNTP
ncbi:MAG: PilZ domain-containing protein [Candidatus Omnitrophica bacterium]|nr:PilZ domain-containing protein [Candidatus Omnitrophota bacterium]MDD5351742.1 PilZ domain-containing protein [Candidatus Omnitrophota bacterium]MDD5550953.1 PilZ domain-containing protein [Candidatus Omnitrophota bacterium]